jgi:hypothetical protein
MRHIFFALLSIFFCSASLFAQDKLLLKSGELLNVKVVEISSKEVRYQVKQGDTYGPLIVMGIDNISSIQYANGTEENLSSLRSEKADLTKAHLLEFNPADLMFNNVSFNYEYYPTAKRDYSVIIPVRLGLPAFSNHFGSRNLVETGVGFLAYPYRNRRINFFTGVELAYQRREEVDYEYYNPYNPGAGYGQTLKHFDRIAAYSTTGIKMYILPRFGFTYSFSVGFIRDLSNADIDLAGKLNVAAFWRF